jgi:hypothetical protein
MAFKRVDASGAGKPWRGAMARITSTRAITALAASA